MWLISGKPELCDLTKSERHQKLFVGLNGAVLFENIYPQFNSHTQVDNLDQIAFMLASNRADYSACNKSGVEALTCRTQTKLYICDDKPVLELMVYSWLHTNYKHLQPLFEQIYRGL